MSKKRIAIYIFAVLPLVMVSLVYNKLPELVPMQWQLGEGVRYGEKWELFIIAVLSLGMGIFMPLIAKIDPRRNNYSKFFCVYENIILVIEVFMAALLVIVLSESMNPGRIPVARVVSGGVGLMFLFMGNLMPKVKSNFFTGVKTPWALSSEAVWNKTQRLGGKAFFFGGLLMALSALLLPVILMPYVVGVLVMIIVFLPTVMSYLWYQEECRAKEN